ncbi:NUDIX domain-containing protein [Hazenella sp. IB182357]|uniref:NUDIX domain-containing protein n=1 Tax=Polycladospora coralii TaxID=2771432 RepID=A0A926ND15_9BACL|nr:NUDIX domain-containing protein [Polycladospora coralii]MBD1373570.1 NUDIX domain-containing protein [Polycladospora coralii]MBS7531943.1 NUDIX domain-containing protein [Polycladospora coralii]
MESERIKIFDEQWKLIGETTRAEAHRIGYWHETFHCWLICKSEGIDYIYLQIRSEKKKDYPNLLDITAAGHLLVDETIADGVRELEEELGLKVSMDELISLGIIKYCVVQESFIDREIAHVFLYRCKNTIDEFKLQPEEVSGLVKIKFEDFHQLWLGLKEEVRVEGFSINSDGKKEIISEKIGKNKFVPHERLYYERVAKLIHTYI